MKNKKQIFSVIIAVTLMAVVATGITLALLKQRTDELKNTFELGNVETEIDEDGEGTVKKSRIKNVGENDCYVRVRVTISPAEAATEINLTGKDEANWDWSQWSNGDGYVYYKKPLPALSTDNTVDDNTAEDTYTSYLFTGVALKEGTNWKSLGIDTFDVTVYQEAVQTKLGDITDMDTIWSQYDSVSSAE